MMDTPIIFTEQNLMQIVDKYLLTPELRIAYFDMLSQFTEYQGTLSDCMYELIGNGFDEIERSNISRFVGDKLTRLEVDFPIVNPLNDVSLIPSEEYYPFAVVDTNVILALEENTTSHDEFDFLRLSTSLIVCDIMSNVLEKYLSTSNTNVEAMMEMSAGDKFIAFTNVTLI